MAAKHKVVVSAVPEKQANGKPVLPPSDSVKRVLAKRQGEIAELRSRSKAVYQTAKDAVDRITDQSMKQSVRFD